MAKAAGQQFEVRVFLYGIEPEIWRRFSVPGDLSFARLHEAIQDAMGWEDKHAHEFRHGTGKQLVDVIGPDDLADSVPPGGEFQDEGEVTLSGFVGRRMLPIRLLYRYDFGDEWVHEVVLEKRVEGNKDGKPVLIDGARACPPEDCGGTFEYNRIVAGECDWWDDDTWDAEKFAPKKVKFR